jgi:hypothetical protein
MPNPEFYQTRMGQIFYEGTMPRLFQALEHIATALECIATALKDQKAPTGGGSEEKGVVGGEK